MLNIQSANGPGGLAFPALRGMSAYQIAVKNGFVGTEQEWLESLGANVAPPDWNQNDPTAKDYIKNRPFYEEVTEAITRDYDGSGMISDAAFCEHLWNHRTEAVLVIKGTECAYSEDESPVSGVAFSVTDGTNKYAVLIATGSEGNPESVIVINYSSGSSISATIHIPEVVVTRRIEPKYLPKPLILNADSADTYLNDSSYGDEALEAIKTGRKVLVRVPNADGGTYTAIYSPIMMYQVPNYANKYLYLFFLRDEKQDLSALLGQAAGTVVMPTYGQLKMLLSQEYNSNPLES